MIQLIPPHRHIERNQGRRYAILYLYEVMILFIENGN